MKNLFLFLFVMFFWGCSNTNEPTITTFPYKDGQIIKKIIGVYGYYHDGIKETQIDTLTNVYVRIKDGKFDFIDMKNEVIILSYYIFSYNNDIINITYGDNNKNNFSFTNISNTYDFHYNSDYIDIWSYYVKFNWNNKQGFLNFYHKFIKDTINNAPYSESFYTFYY